MNGTPTEFDAGDDGDLRDPALRRALAHAPDRDATPDPRTRDAILKMAHNLAAAPVSTASAANSASVLPWWRRLWGGGGAQGSRMPWNAAFATVLVAAFVTVLWRSEPVPQARLDGEASVGGAAAPAAESPAVSAAPPAPEAPAAPAVSAAPPAPAAAAATEPVPVPPVVAKQAPVAPSADAAAQAAPAPAPARAPAPEQRAQVLRDASSAKETARAQPSRKEATHEPVAPAPAPAIVAEQSAPAPAQEERREERVERERRSAFAAPAAPAAPVSPPTPPPAIAAAPLSRSAPRASALASQDDANAQASGALQDAAPRAAKAAPPQAGASSFSALERWTSFSAGGGERRARGDVEGLPALVGTVARSATSPDASLDAPVQARLLLYRGDALIAVLEIAGDQVRWTPQPGGTARVGTPPAQALDALRSLLAR